jgi:hypothetical protein
VPETSLPGWAVAAGCGLISVVLGLVGWLLKRAISELDDRFSGLAAQIGALQAKLEDRAEQTGAHAVSLGIVSAQLGALEKRVERLEGEP